MIEKAISKFYGKYYFESSTNPAIEMHHITGWIPETVKFADVSNKANLWNRMKLNFKEGHIILCICKETNTSFNGKIDNPT